MGKQLQMVWEGSTSDIPKITIPSEYEIRALRDGDEAGHVAVMREAGFATWDEKQIETWRSLHALPDGIFVIVSKVDDKIVATAMATHRTTAPHPSGGELGWVAASGDHAGKGLGRAVCIAVLNRYVEAGYKHIYLNTDDHRLAAIKVYLKIGFKPYIFASDMEERWKIVCDNLKWPFDAKSCPRPSKEFWIQEPEEDERKDQDDLNRYAKRRKWLPNREHRGFSSIGDVDAFGDESLYKPSLLGTATVVPEKIMAGASSPIKLTYTAGSEGVPEDASVTFVIRGQNPLGYIPKFSITHSGKCELDLKQMGFVVKKGYLVEGDVVTLESPAFKWTPLAGRREFKVVINCGDDQPERRLPEPLVVHILPKKLHKLETLLSCTHTPLADLELQVTARDEYDNRVPYSGCVEVLVSGEEKTVTLQNGFGVSILKTEDENEIRVSARSPFGAERWNSNVSVPSTEMQAFVGDLHCHDFTSEAEGYPDDVYKWARDDKKLDFVSVVPQQHGWLDNETWTIAKYMNERFLEEGKFVTFLGFEWQHTGYGDKVVHFLGGDQPYLPVDDMRYATPAKLYEALRESDALIISHHPCYPPDSWCASTDFDKVENDVERLVELWSMHGSSEGYDPNDRPFQNCDPTRQVMAALKRGVRLGFTGGSDTHSGRPGGSAREPREYWGGLTGVWAMELTRRSLFEAIKARRTYALTDKRITLKFKLNNFWMGSEIPFDENVEIEVEAWAPEKIAKVEIMKNGDLFKSINGTDDVMKIRITDKIDKPAFYHCRITTVDGGLAVPSPVWVG